MRTSARAFLIVFALLAMCISPNVHADITIDSTVTVSTDQIWYDNVIIIAGGNLVINGANLTIYPGYDLTVAGGSLTVGPYSDVTMENGNVTLEPASVANFDTGGGLNFRSDGQLILNGGSYSCSTAFIRGAAPSYGTDIIINDGTALIGYCVISSMNIQIVDPMWTIDGGTDIILKTYGTIQDPTASGSNVIDVSGTLCFNEGNFYINTNSTYRIPAININGYGELEILSATVYALPDIIGQPYSDIAIDNAVCHFEQNMGIDTRGNVDMSYSKFSEYTTLAGWDGIYIHDYFVTADFDNCRIENTNNYAIWLDNLQGASGYITTCTIFNPSTAYTGYGIRINGNTYPTDCMIECTYIAGFDRGLYLGLLGAAELANLEITNNNTGCYYNESVHANMMGSSVHDNIINGIVIIGGMDNIISESEIIDNGTLQVYADAGSVATELFAETCNIYSTDNVYPLVYVAGGSNANFTNVYWIVYPPVLGTHIYSVGGSFVVFPNYQQYPLGINGYLACGMQYPKSSSEHQSTAAPSTANISVSNYPNPFNPSTEITYTLPYDMNVMLSVYSLDGKHVATLADDYQTAGQHSISFNAPKALSSGVYLYILRCSGGTVSGVMVLSK